MAPVKYKIYSLYADKSANFLMQNCASYFRRINQSYTNYRVCKLFAGLHNIVNLNSFHNVYITVIARLATKAALWVRIQAALKKQNKATKKWHSCPLKTMENTIYIIQLVEIDLC